MQAVGYTPNEEHEVLIEKMVPFIMSGNYSQGLNSLKIDLDDETRMILVYETVRRVQLCNASVDNSDFAEYPVKSVKVGKLTCKLDRIGQKILQSQLKVYQNRYTLGVAEACISPKVYQHYLKQEVTQKRKKAYSIPWVGYPKVPPEQPALVPNYKIHSQQFFGGRHVQVIGFSETTLILKDKEQIALPRATICKVVFPPIINKKQNTNILIYEFVDSQENDDGTYVSRLFLSPKNAKEKIAAVQDYIRQHLSIFPLVLEQEEARTKHGLERDLAVYNSQQMAVFCNKSANILAPVAAMVTEANQTAFPFWRQLAWFPEEERLTSISNELAKYGHAIYLKGIVDQDSVRYPVCATLRELVKTETLNRFVTACDPESILIIQCHLVSGISKQMHQAVGELAHHKDAKEQLDNVDCIVFCQNITPFIGRLLSHTDPVDLELPEKFREHSKQPITHFVLADPVNKRSENRFHFENTQAKVYTGRIASVTADVVDVSRHGLKLRLTKKTPIKLKENVRVSIKSIKLNRSKYRVVEYNPHYQILRLKVSRKDAYRTSLHLEKLFKDNAAYYKERNTNLANKQMFDVLFQLAAENFRLPALTLKSGVLDHQKLSRLFANDPEKLGLDIDHKTGKVDMSEHLADCNSKKLDSDAIKSLTLHKRVCISLLQNQETGESKPFHYQKLNDPQYLESLQKTLQSGKYRIRFLTYLPVKAERPLNRIQNKNLALLSNLDREAVFMAKGLQYEISHVVAIEDLSAIYTVCVNYDVLIKSYDNA
ncbi:MAG: hypothetical protein ACFHVJ_16980 [Aestuariibacter sp.]